MQISNNKLSLMVILNIILIVTMSIKQMSYLRIFDNFGSLVQLFGQCLIDVFTFLIFFVGFIFFFSLLFHVLGVEINNEDYPYLTIQYRYALYAYRNSIGDIHPPIYNFWIGRTSDSPFYSTIMIAIIWFFWLMN